MPAIVLSLLGANLPSASALEAPPAVHVSSGAGVDAQEIDRVRLLKAQDSVVVYARRHVERVGDWTFVMDATRFANGTTSMALWTVGEDGEQIPAEIRLGDSARTLTIDGDRAYSLVRSELAASMGDLVRDEVLAWLPDVLSDLGAPTTHSISSSSSDPQPGGSEGWHTSQSQGNVEELVERIRDAIASLDPSHDTEPVKDVIARMEEEIRQWPDLGNELLEMAEDLLSRPVVEELTNETLELLLEAKASVDAWLEETGPQVVDVIATLEAAAGELRKIVADSGEWSDDAVAELLAVAGELEAEAARLGDETLRLAKDLLKTISQVADEVRSNAEEAVSDLVAAIEAALAGAERDIDAILDDVQASVSKAAEEYGNPGDEVGFVSAQIGLVLSLVGAALGAGADPEDPGATACKWECLAAEWAPRLGVLCGWVAKKLGIVNGPGALAGLACMVVLEIYKDALEKLCAECREKYAPKCSGEAHATVSRRYYNENTGESRWYGSGSASVSCLRPADSIDPFASLTHTKAESHPVVLESADPSTMCTGGEQQSCSYTFAEHEISPGSCVVTEVKGTAHDEGLTTSYFDDDTACAVADLLGG